jgi:hypothetical protein
MDWHAMVFLGAYHGINPGMGWLFAVALGMQQTSARGVWRALPPIALGHAMAVTVVLVIVGLARVVVPLDALRVLVASTLIALGLYRMWRHRHPRFGGMQVGFRDLTVWSFLMASAHGAGFMVVPFVMPTLPTLSAASHEHASHMASASTNVAAADRRRSHAGVSDGDGSGRMGCVSQAGPGSSSQGLVQHGLGVGRRFGRYRRGRDVEIVADLRDVILMIATPARLTGEGAIATLMPS